MNLPQIEFTQLLIALIPVVISIVILFRWSMNYKTARKPDWRKRAESPKEILGRVKKS